VELNQERQDKEKHSVTHALRARQTSATDTPKQDMDPEDQNTRRKKLKSAGPGSESGNKQIWQTKGTKKTSRK
jgi:hypothetical protein